MKGESIDNEEKDNDVEKNTQKPKSKVEERVSLATMFSTANSLDIFFMVVGTICAIVTGIAIPFFNVLFGKILDQLNGSTSSEFDNKINTIVFAFLGVAGISLFTGYCQVAFWSLTGERQTQRMRESYVHAILSQEIGWFDTVGATELSTKVADVIGKIEDGIGRKIGDMIQYIAQFVGSFIVGFYLSWRLTVVLLASFPLIAGAGAFMISAISSAQQQALVQYSKAGGLATETLSSVRTVTALNAQVTSINQYRIFLLEAMHIGIRKGFNVGLGNGALFAACFGTYALGFWYGAKLVADDIDAGCTAHCLTGGTILAVFFSVIVGSMAMGQIAPPMIAVTSALASAVPLFKLTKELATKEEAAKSSSANTIVPTEKLSGEIIFSKVNFAYPTRIDDLVCRDYNLTINKGESIALVGQSGCGKSTIMNLLLKFYEAEGDIKVDGYDIKSLHTRWYRSQIGYVGQEPVLFSGTIAENIAFGLDKEFTPTMPADELQQKVISAAKLANAHEFILTFPSGYDTDVGSNGIALSGGQKQRIAIARALIRRPAVLLLDEATSALDASSEAMVQESIDMLQQNKAQTTIIIAHRLSTIRNADKIAVIQGGQIAELGPHEELLARNGLYAELVSKQLSSVVDTDIIKTSRALAHGNSTSANSQLSLEKIYLETEVSTASRTHNNEVEVVEAMAKPVSDDTSTDKDAENMKNKEFRAKIWALVYKHKAWFALGVLGAAVFGAVFPVWGLILAKTQRMFYFTDTDRIREYAANLAYIYISLGVIALLSCTSEFWGIAQVGERISAQLRSDLYEAFMRHEIAYFDDEEHDTGTLTTRLSDDSRIMNKAFSEASAKQVQAIFTLLIGLGIAFSASYKIALVVLATFPLNIIASAIQMQGISGQQYDHQDTETQSSSITNAAKRSAAAQKSSANKADKKKYNNMSSNDNKEETQVAVQVQGHGALISTAFTHMRTICALSMQYHVEAEYNRLTCVNRDRRMGRAHVAGLGFGGAQLSLFSTYALLFWYGSTLIKSGEIDFEQLMTAILCLMLGALGLGQALTDLGDQGAGLLAAGRIFTEIEQASKSKIDGLSDDQGIIPLAEHERSVGRIEMKHLHFAYPTRKEIKVCDDYNLTIEPGEVVALVGSSGSGKSTIMNLLLRFYDPLSGEFLFDGHNIQTLNPKWLRSQIGYVGQEPVLFSGTIAENIAKGRAADNRENRDNSTLLPLSHAMKKSDAEVGIFGKSAVANTEVKVAKIQDKQYMEVNGNDIEEQMPALDVMKSKRDILHAESVRESIAMKISPDIIEAAKLANAHDFIKSFPKGYDTDVGEASVMVSGGQKQRIAIARALIRRPAVLLLDEATSALDAGSEAMVQESIDMLQQNKAQTTIIIAHRLSTIRNADKIAVIQDGRVVELGRHEELLALDGVYATLWLKQGGDKSMSRDPSSIQLNR